MSKPEPDYLCPGCGRRVADEGQLCPGCHWEEQERRWQYHQARGGNWPEFRAMMREAVCFPLADVLQWLARKLRWKALGV